MAVYNKKETVHNNFEMIFFFRAILYSGINLMEEKSVEEQIKENKKGIRKEASRVGWGLILYSAISFFCVMSSFIAAVIQLAKQYPQATEQDAIYIEMMEKCEASGTASAIGVCIGVLFLLWFFRKRVSVSSLMYTEKKMNVKIFLQLLCVFMGSQLLFNIVGELLEGGLNLIGYSAMKDLESASSASSTVSMFIYASIVGPIVEELVYRGFVLRSFQKYGKLAAVIISSILFGVMHANLPQSMFAFGVGLILGYVAVEYSIVWSIVLHIINNCIFGDIFGWAISGLSEQMQEYISGGVLIVFGVVAVFIIWWKRNVIKAFFEENRTENKICRYVFSSCGMLLFVLGEVHMAIMMLQKL